MTYNVQCWDGKKMFFAPPEEAKDLAKSGLVQLCKNLQAKDLLPATSFPIPVGLEDEKASLRTGKRKEQPGEGPVKKPKSDKPSRGKYKTTDMKAESA